MSDIDNFEQVDLNSFFEPAEIDKNSEFDNAEVFTKRQRDLMNQFMPALLEKEEGFCWLGEPRKA